MLQHSEACERNKEPILEVIRDVFEDVRSVLEIGSGTGQHAVYFARFMPHLIWYPTDLTDNTAAIQARLDLERGENIKPPSVLDVSRRPWPIRDVDAVFTANSLHIMSWPQVEDFFRGLDTALRPGGVLCIYGPFNMHGEYTSASNEQFDRQLKQRDPASGIRDFEDVDVLARRASLEFQFDHSLPANNRLIIWRKSGNSGNSGAAGHHG